ncbi:MAG: cisplatin damage response ATP-dependent DNA ligase, partial [Rhizobiaceae bacterium]|nr:cisplatin damage response ATP-dependent DNA ligase [Rhizobiaceae bacterium]
MERFAQLLDDLYFTNSTNAKERILASYLSTSPDPDRGWALAAIAGTLSFDLFKRNLSKNLIVERMDEELFALSYDYVGELSETIALAWPVSENPILLNKLPGLTETITEFQSRGKEGIRQFLVQLLDNMTPPQRWALLKLGTRGLRIGMSARSVKRVIANMKGVDLEEIEELWHGLEPPYLELFAWIDCKGEKPDVSASLNYQPVMLSHPLDEEKDLERIAPDTHQVEWKWDGIRVQLASNGTETKLFSRTGDDISHSFPDLVNAVDFEAVVDGELLVAVDGDLGSFNDLQQRLNKKKPSNALMTRAPAHLRVYDILSINGENKRNLALGDRRTILERFVEPLNADRFSISELLKFESVDDLYAMRRHAEGSNGRLEGLMIKRKDSAYVSGRPKHAWYKWKCDPKLIDAVLMYAQLGHGKRSSYYSDYTFGLWNEEGQLLPIGKAYFGFTDEELKQLDNWIRRNKMQRFGPVQEVTKELVFEVAFDSAHRSTRHKSGYALRFP